VLTWTNYPGVIEYRIYRANTPFFTPGAPYATTTNTSFADANVIGDPNVNHYYAVGAATSTSEVLCLNRVGEFDFALTAGSPTDVAYNDLAIPLDITGSIGNAEALATWIETQGGAPFGSVVQLLKWEPTIQNFMAWSHEFGFGENFTIAAGDYLFITLDENAPAVTTFVGRVPQPGEVSFPLTPGTPSDCAINFMSLPMHLGNITTADQLADAVGTPNPPGPPSVIQSLDWLAPIQNFQVWSNQFNFGDNFTTPIGHPYILCTGVNVPATWP
jgi:hypothetical protein